jgi:uncharacterized protein YceK
MSVPHHPSGKAVAVLLAIAAVVIAFGLSVLLSGCAIPIPFTGPDMGKYGFVRVGVTYEPNALTTPYLSNLNKWTNYVSTNQYK